MSEKLGAEAVSRRSALSFLGLAAASSLTILSSVLTTSDAEARTAAMVRREERREDRQDRREERRDDRLDRREERRDGVVVVPDERSGVVVVPPATTGSSGAPK